MNRSPDPKVSPVAGANPLLPGLKETGAGLEQSLRHALEERGPDYHARTRHLTASGTPKFVNRLILQSSPYLLQHAHNPVSWFPWGPEAFARAAQEGKPVLLSIGYSTCHWCHVMERESFEDEEVATFINQHFIAIKVDREERPDVDEAYMQAVQLLTGRGGWPMTVALTPDKQPFFAGTYFPARDGDRGASLGLLSLLQRLSHEYASNRPALLTKASELSRRMAAPSAAPGVRLPRTSDLEAVFEGARASFDQHFGGFGRAPKFPRPALPELLLRYYRRSAEPEALALVVGTLDGMEQGGVYDHVAGGFHRYSTDARWLVPHFEKMLYDNAQLVSLYLEAYQVTRNPRYAEVARETLDYVARDMSAPEGGFFSATDADSLAPSGEEEEGYYFTWTPSELEQHLSPERARVVATYYGVTPSGNFEGRTILSTSQPQAEVAKQLGISVGELQGHLAEAKEALRAARNRRPAPLRDGKILTSWNGLMISAFAQASRILADEGYRKSAERATEYVLSRLRNSHGRLLRTARVETTGVNAVAQTAGPEGFLDDYAFFIQALLDLFEATAQASYFEAAIELQAIQDGLFWDSAGAGYFTSGSEHERLLTREKPLYDGAEPSGNAVSVLNLLRLAELSQRPEYRARAQSCLAAFGPQVDAAPYAYPKMLSALERALDRPREIFIVVPEGAAPDAADALLNVSRATYLPNRFLLVVREGQQFAELSVLVPTLAYKQAKNGRPTAYVCEQGNCQFPTSEPATFARQLAQVEPLLGEAP